MKAHRRIVYLLAIAGWPSVAAGAVLNVPTPAYPTIQSAILAATEGDEVVVAPGVYHESISFGTAAITVRSSIGPAVTTIDASGLDARVVTFPPGTGPSTVFSGFTVTGGRQLAAWPNNAGAGIYCDRASPTIHDCILENNVAEWGGGLAVLEGTPTVTNCVFRNNHATFRGGAVLVRGADASFVQCTFEMNHAVGDGGAMINVYSSPTLIECLFEGNSAGIDGGGMYCLGSTNLGGADPIITRCIFRLNSAVRFGGSVGGASLSNPVIRDSMFVQNTAQRGAGVYLQVSSLDASGCLFDANTASDRGGAIFVWFASVTVSDSLFIGNTSTSDGGAVSHHSDDGSIYSHNRFIGNASGDGGAAFMGRETNIRVVNCLFEGNHAAGHGGAMSVQDAVSTAVNCTIVANVAGIEAHALHNDGGTVGVTNCIMRNGGDEIVEAGWAATTVAYSDIEGSWPGMGNIDEDPRFVDADGADGLPGTVDDDLRLRFGSSSIDAGSNASVPSEVLTDLNGDPRFVDDPAIDPDPGAGLPPVVDMGAYEYQVDCNENSVRDDVDIANGTSMDCNENRYPDECEPDTDDDSTIDDCDNCPDTVNDDQLDGDGDGIGDACDACPGESPNDADGDGVCFPLDLCPADPGKTEPGVCGCGEPDLDSDADGVVDCDDGCPADPAKSEPGLCGCGVSDGDTDADSTPDCLDACPDDPYRTQPGRCGCGVDDTIDSDGDQVPDCLDICPGVDDGLYAPNCPESIPAANTWGLTILCLLILVGAKVGVGTPRRTRA